MRHPATFCNWLEDRSSMIDLATSETCGAYAGRYCVGRFEGVGDHGWVCWDSGVLCLWGSCILIKFEEFEQV